MRFYEKTLGGTMQMMMTIGEAPDTEQMPPEVKKRIMHASLAYGEGMLMASDTMPGQAYEGMKGFGDSRKRWWALMVLCLGVPDDRARHHHRQRGPAFHPHRPGISPRPRWSGWSMPTC
jgi:hypothetical protein